HDAHLAARPRRHSDPCAGICPRRGNALGALASSPGSRGGAILGPLADRPPALARTDWGSITTGRARGRSMSTMGAGARNPGAGGPLPLGKLRATFMASLFNKHVTLDDRVVLGPRVGEDAAVIDMGDRYLVATTDPITFVTEDLGWYALVVNANDLA